MLNASSHFSLCLPRGALRVPSSKHIREHKICLSALLKVEGSMNLKVYLPWWGSQQLWLHLPLVETWFIAKMSSLLRPQLLSVAGGCGGSTKGQYLQVPVLSPQEGSGRRLLLSLATTQPSQSSSGRAPGHPPPSAPSWVVQGGSGCVVPTSSQGSGAG